MSNLVVVDIQYMFSGYFNDYYLQKTKTFIESKKWDRVITVFNEKTYRDEEDKLEHIPKWLHEYSTHIVQKRIEHRLHDNYVKDLMKHGFVEESLDRAWRKDEFLVLRTPTVHELFYVPKELQTIAKEMNECVLIGGGVDYCLKDIESSLRYLGVKVHVEEDFTYGLSEWIEPGKYSENGYGEEWVSAKK